MPDTGIDWRTVAVQELYPTRVRIIERLATCQERSPKQLSDELHMPLGNVAYHVRVLLRKKVIRRTRTRMRRGAMEHFYAVRKGVVHE